ncbi:MAG: hypothetical protein ABIX01_20145 [Chitinophagaceae bacterium]
MLRKIIHTQKNPVLVLDLPKNLQGRRIEVIAFAIEEEATTDTKAVTMGDFFGTLSPEHAESLHQHAKQARNEWDRDF